MIMVYIFLLVIICFGIIGNYKVYLRLNRREEKLESYARDLDDWSRDIKTRQVMVNGFLRYVRLLGAVDPKLKSQADIILAEMAADEGD